MVVWQQQGVSLENNKHQNRKISNRVVLQQRSSLHINWTVTERLWFLFFFPFQKWVPAAPSFTSCLIFCCVIPLSVCVQRHMFNSVQSKQSTEYKDTHTHTHTGTAAAAVVVCCQPCPAWPTLDVSGIGEGLFQPAKEKPLYVTSVVMEK